MNSDDIQLFAHVAKVGSLSRAAIELGMNQSTISRRIGVLESELGVRLFWRSGRGVGVTERGAQLLGYAHEIEYMISNVRNMMNNANDRGPASLTIAAQPTIARIMFGRLGHRLRVHYPSTRIRFVEGLASQLLGNLNEGTIDLAIMYVPEHQGAMQYEPFLSEDVCLITPGTQILSGESIDVIKLGDFPLILPSTHHGLRVLVENLASRYEFTPNIVLECDGSISLTKRLVMEQCGCTILPAASVIEDVSTSRLGCIRLSNPVVRRDVAIAWPQNRVMPDGIWNIAHVIRDLAADLVSDGSWPGTTLKGDALESMGACSKHRHTIPTSHITALI